MESSNNPLVSVLIPVWGEYKKYLPRCLKSVNAQTYKNIEIIIIDSETNAPRAFNKGLKRAKGKYIAHLGVDDTWKPDKIKRQVECMEYLPNCALCTSWSEDNRFNMWRISRAPYYVQYKDILKAFNYSSGSTYFMRRKDIPLMDESLPSGQDYDLALQLLKGKDKYAVCIPRVLVTQYSTPEQISTNWGKKIRGIYILAKKYGEDYSIVDWFKVVGLMGIYFSGYFLGVKINRLIVWGKKLHE